MFFYISCVQSIHLPNAMSQRVVPRHKVHAHRKCFGQRHLHPKMVALRLHPTTTDELQRP